ncbi:type VI secretion system protein TssA [Vibrio alginolyticus]|uniref:type VI secretion system protein TssA n=1 Tax=Vibrio alginolyticus TaxID=663 RepID=UPI0007202C8C|nr:type VI secretion system protein TssA [Vibrio alginolyticus]ALR91669.1 type VI secretion protein [Vibrio alginolyticus]MBY7710582.1 type VI secretion system protein TssA [Vibrio alginolyticus]
MELDSYRTAIATPISPENPVGERLVDDPMFEFIETQMMKVGSLSHGNVQWEEVEHSTVTLLRDKTKDLKLLAILLQCLHQDMTPSRWVVSFEILGDFMARYWVTCHPASGDRGNLVRRRFYSQISQRFSTASKTVNYAQFGSEHQVALQDALDGFKQALQLTQLGSDDVTEQLLQQAEQGLRREAPSQTPAVMSVTQTSTQPEPTVSVPTVDNSSDKAAKTTLLNVANFLAEQELAMPLSIRLKRFALWGNITAAPDHNAQGITQLRSMQADRIRDYQAQLTHPDLALWRKVEQSLTMAPFWFEGQWMSHHIAKQLGHDSWCSAIVQECASFLERLPVLMTLTFKDGSPFVSDDVKQWLTDVQSSKGAHEQGGGDWHNQRQEALTLAKDGGIAVALTHLNDRLAQANEPRDKAYWRLLIADVLRANQLDAMAAQHYQTLYTQISTLSVTDWEPSLMAQLQQHTQEQ